MTDIAYDAYKDAEVGVLGSILVDADFCLNDILLAVTEEDFLTNDAKAIWKAIVALHDENIDVDPYTVKSRAPATYSDLVEQLIAVTPTSANYEAYVAELKRHSKLDKAKTIATSIVQDAMRGASSIDEMREQAEELLTVLENTYAIKTDYSAHEMMKHFFDNAHKPKKYVDFGMQALNKNMLCAPGSYVLIGATPSTGKTALSVQFMLEMAKKGTRVLFFSYEMTQEDIAEKMISYEARIPYDNIQRSNYTNDEEYRYGVTTHQLYNLPFEVVEAGGMKIEDIRAKIIKYNAEVVFIDYIQQIVHKNEKLTEFQRITEISRSIQQICKKYKVVVIALSQFARLGGNKPTMSSFRSSGQLEQDADIAILFYRPEEVQEGEKDVDRVFEIAKNRKGITGKLRMHFDGEYQTFTMQENRYD